MVGTRPEPKTGPPPIDYWQREKVQERVLSFEGDRWAENGNQLQGYETELHDGCPTCGSLPAARTDA